MGLFCVSIFNYITDIGSLSVKSWLLTALTISFRLDSTQSIPLVLQPCDILYIHVSLSVVTQDGSFVPGLINTVTARVHRKVTGPEEGRLGRTR